MRVWNLPALLTRAWRLPDHHPSFPWRLNPIKVGLHSLHPTRQHRPDHKIKPVAPSGPASRAPPLSPQRLHDSDMSSAEVQARPAWSAGAIIRSVAQWTERPATGRPAIPRGRSPTESGCRHAALVRIQPDLMMVNAQWRYAAGRIGTQAPALDGMNSTDESRDKGTCSCVGSAPPHKPESLPAATKSKRMPRLRPFGRGSATRTQLLTAGKDRYPKCKKAAPVLLGTAFLS